ncbi:hypothetical protein ABH940_002350 [Streptacidiphilus sp. BW17]
MTARTVISRQVRTHQARTSRSRVLAAVGCAVLSFALAACGPKNDPPAEPDPASLAPAPSMPGVTTANNVHRVVLTPLAARQIGVRTVPVQAASGGKGEQVPITAVVYDPEGVPWVYVPDGKLTYLRRPITVQGYDGDTVVLSTGPAVGTPVAVQGVAELLGTEYGVGEE